MLAVAWLPGKMQNKHDRSVSIWTYKLIARWHRIICTSLYKKQSFIVRLHMPAQLITRQLHFDNMSQCQSRSTPSYLYCFYTPASPCLVYVAARVNLSSHRYNCWLRKWRTWGRVFVKYLSRFFAVWADTDAVGAVRLISSYSSCRLFIWTCKVL